MEMREGGRRQGGGLAENTLGKSNGDTGGGDPGVAEQKESQGDKVELKAQATEAEAGIRKTAAEPESLRIKAEPEGRRSLTEPEGRRDMAMPEEWRPAAGFAVLGGKHLPNSVTSFNH